MSYMLSLQNMYPFRDNLRYFKRCIFFIVKLNFGDSNSCYCMWKLKCLCTQVRKKDIAMTNRPNYHKSYSGKGSWYCVCNTGDINLFLRLW